MTPPVLKPGLLASPGDGDQRNAALPSVPLLCSLATLDLVRLRLVGRDWIGVGSCLGALLVFSSFDRNAWWAGKQKEEITGNLSFFNLKLVGTCKIFNTCFHYVRFVLLLSAY